MISFKDPEQLTEIFGSDDYTEIIKCSICEQSVQRSPRENDRNVLMNAYKEYCQLRDELEALESQFQILCPDTNDVSSFI